MGKINFDLYTDDEILAMPIAKLAYGRVQNFSSKLRSFIHRELVAKGINFKPILWCSTEWFSPDGAPGFAYPFYLLDERLKNIYLNYFYEIEGINENEIKKIVRHECAHALDNAFGLRRLKRRQQLFGLTSKKYPSVYTYEENNDFIHNLGDCYGLSHPDEDWAETFAVWLSGEKINFASDVANEKFDYLSSVFENKKNFETQINKPINLIENALGLELTFEQFIKIRKESIRKTLAISGNKIYLINNKKELYDQVFRSVISPSKAKIISRNLFDISEILRKQTGEPKRIISQSLIKLNGLNQVVM